MSTKRPAVQSLLAAALVLAGHLADGQLHGLAGLGHLDFAATAALVSGLSFGWPALAGSVLVSLVHCTLLPSGPCSFGAVLACALLTATGATILWLPRRLGWSLISIEAYTVAVAAAGIAASGSAWLLAAARDPTVTLNEFWSGWGQLTASLILMAALLLRIVNRLLKPWVHRAWLPDLHLARPERASLARWLLVLALIVGVGLTVRQTLDMPPTLHEWARLLFVLPIVLLGRHGLREGVVAGCLAGIAAYVADAADPLPPAGARAELARQAAATVFPLLGAVIGWAFEREWEARRELRAALANTVQALRGSLAVRHVPTEDHTVRVARYAVETGRRLGLEGGELEALETAGLLHDIGKIGVPDAVLRKPGPLRWHEAEQMRQHAEIGARLLQQIHGLEAAIPLVRHHQERYDGRTVGPHPGYPDGLAGEAIPLGSRIIAVVDAFDAMTSDREYRKARSVEEAVAELRAERGKQFDPKVVDAFLEALAARPWRPGAPADEDEEPAVLESILADKADPSPSSSQV
ncbi:MAG: HD domain-containing phosphohydrolase [Thermoanaerobaculia bacterium]